MRNPLSQDCRGCGSRHKLAVLDNSLDMGGLEKKLLDLAVRLDRSHFGLCICCLKSGGFLKEKFVELGYPFYDELLRFKYDLFAWRKLAGIFAREKVELIYSFLHPNTVVFSYLAKKRGLVKRWVVSVHATGAAEGGKLVKGYLRPLLREVDAFIAVARSHKKYLVEQEGMPDGKVTVIYNGVDTQAYSPSAPDSDLAREFAVGEGERVVITVATLKPLKRIDLLLEAFRLALDRMGDLRLIVVGDGPERNRLEAMAAAPGLVGKVSFTGMRQDVERILSLGDVFVLSSRTEAFPNALLEAMACGLPVVATGVGSVPELLAGGGGIVVEAGDAAGLARAIVEVVADRGKAQAMGREGRRVVENKFSLEAMCEEREKLFCSLLCPS